MRVEEFTMMFLLREILTLVMIAVLLADRRISRVGSLRP
jgi:hypothetical protein